jgi:L-ascorbate metabolism protein UlaG (beta-lactamase superfamily)
VAASITVLGSSSGMPSGSRGCSGYVIEFEKRLTLFDCGSGVARAIQAQGFQLTELDRIIISHTHPDHVCDLPLLIQHCHLSKKTTPLDIFVPSEFVGPLNQIIRAMYVIPERFKFGVNIRGYEAGDIVKHPIQIRAIANSHFASYAADVQRLKLPNRLQSHSLTVKIDGAVVLYSGDIGGFDDIAGEIAKADFVFMETSHIDIVKVGECIGANPSKQFVLTHLTSGETMEPLYHLVQSFTNVQLAKDGMRVELG